MTFVANTGDQAACLTKGERYDLDTETFIAAAEGAYEYAEKLVDRAHGAFQDGAGLASPPSAADGPTRIAPSAAAPLIADTVRSHPRPGSNSDGNIVIAAPLSHGSNPNSNAAGRRREDDFNLVAGTLAGGNDGIGRRSEDDPNLVTYALQERSVSENPNAGPQGAGWKADEAYTLEARHHVQMVAQASVRRLTPTECERLQGFPDGWTDLGNTPDSRRYAALGDAVTVPVAEWIGRRIMGAE